MHIPKHYRIPVIAGAVALIALIAAGAYVYDKMAHPLPETVTFRSTHFSFDYPREYTVVEYDSGVVSVGKEEKGKFQPLVEVIRYQNDKNAISKPASFAAYLRPQLLNLCGTDEPNQFVACTEPEGVPYQSPTGFTGQQFDMQLVKTDMALGTTTPLAFGPIYVFNVTTPEQEPPIRYSAIVVYPSVDAVKKGLETRELKELIMQTLDLTPDGGA